MAWPVSENGVLDLEVGEASGMHTKRKQSEAKTKRVFGTLENNAADRNSL